MDSRYGYYATSKNGKCCNFYYLSKILLEHKTKIIVTKMNKQTKSKLTSRVSQSILFSFAMDISKNEC